MLLPEETEEKQEEDSSNDAEEPPDEEEKQEDNEEQNQKPPQWKNSAAKAYLYKLIVDNKIPDRKHIKPRQVFETYCQERPEFKHFQDYSNFASRLLSLRNKAEEKGERADADSARLEHDRAIFPKPTVDTKGFAMWQGSEAQKLLRQDIESGKNTTMKPKLLYETKSEYYENYSLEFFRNRIYQEVKFNKRERYVKLSIEKRAAKKK